MAIKISLRPGDRVFCDDHEYEVLGPAGLAAVNAREVETGKELILDVDKITVGIADEDSCSYDSLESLSDEDRALALHRFSIIKPLLQKEMSRTEVEALAAAHGIHAATIYRMVNVYRTTMSPAALVPKIGLRGGKGKPRVTEAVDAVIRECFESIYKANLVDLTKLSVKSLQKDIKRECKPLGLKPPSWGTVSDRLERFIKEKKLGKRRGRKGPRPRTMAAKEFPGANRPLAVVQVDHTPLDLIIVDDQHREPIGRPYLSVAIDVFSRMVVGFSVSLDAPSIFGVGRLIAHCILPKTQFLNGVGIDAQWDVYGVMGMLHMDNAGEFRTEDFVPFQNEYGVEVRWRPVARPEYGGHIERLAGTLNTYIHQEPGSTMSNIFQRSGYDSEKNASYTLSEIEKWLTILITKIYHFEQHSSLENRRGEKLSPFEKFTLGILGDDNTPGTGLPEVVRDQERLKIFLLPAFHRTVQREGVQLDNIHYFHDILRSLYGHKDENGKPKTYLVKRDPRLISPIYIFDPNLQKYFSVPYRDLTRPPMNLWELKAAKKRCKDKGLRNPNEQQIFKAYEELRQLREEAVANTKRARRERQAEKRRKKAPAVYQSKKEPVATVEENETQNVEDVASFYDDASLLDGVIVKKKADREED